MKRFILLLWLITLAGSAFLHFKLYFSGTTLLYHFGVVGLVHLGLCAWIFLTGIIKTQKLRYRVIDITAGLFLLAYILFYLSVIFSNLLWGKTITLAILSDYLLSIHKLISVLPLDGWIVYTAFVFLLLFVIVLYRIFRIRKIDTWLPGNVINALAMRKKWLVVSVLVAITLVFVFIRPLLHFKRQAHFSGEPLSEFIWGPMWYPESLDDIYNPQKQRNSISEQACIDSIVPHDKKPEHTSVVILIDALRGDHLPMYGYDRMTTPFLDSLYRANQLMAVQHAYSNSSGTLIGVAGLFSSKNWDDFGYAGLSLMKFMRKTNHSTYAFLTGHHRTWYGLTAIYRNDTEVFYESATSYAEIDLDDLTTLRKFEETPINKGSFVYMHLLSTHDLGRKAEQFRQFQPDKIGLGVSQKTALINNYDNGILQADYVIRKVFEKLRKEGNLANSTVYIVSDHGQLFGEYGQWNHASSINPTVISIPMLIYDSEPGFYKNLSIASIKDVAPSLADRIGYPIPSCWQGQSLGDSLAEFSLRVDIENKCAIPGANLYFRADTLWLDMLDPEKKLAGRAFLNPGGKDWIFTKPLPE
jgi:glucan phosphoethanolaminetransferase (alkaline phosphatase superfamily)